MNDLNKNTMPRKYQAHYWTASERGSRSHMEDRSFVRSDSKGRWLEAGVFDGHGGAAVSSYCETVFPELGKSLANNGALYKSEVELRDFVKAYYKTVQDKVERSKIGFGCGSTAVHAYFDLANGAEGCLSCVGDSKILVFDGEGSSLVSTDVHKYEKNALERKRLEPFVTKEPDLIRTTDGTIFGDEKRKANATWRLRGRLAMTRSFGDCSVLKREELADVKKRPLISVPDVYRFRPPSDSDTIYVVLCSDGLTDVLTDEEIAEATTDADPRIAAMYPNPVKRLLKAAREKANSYSLGDNFTIVVVQLEAI